MDNWPLGGSIGYESPQPLPRLLITVADFRYLTVFLNIPIGENIYWISLCARKKGE